ncbi:MAG: ABC transporter substrate-binding protein [Gammaproteobacteria bacterium]|nr:ABC transporter substrate-binding protein [Gammaproteobacteria bacterium]MCB1922998.1 ABC transporter substrate-binding protein [Gammaproteobacteria bacterium]
MWLCFAGLFAASAMAADTPQPVRVGVLQFGTVNWEMAVIERQGLARQFGVALQIVPLSSKNAVSVALQGGAVDVIVGDWLWVNRQRAAGRDYRFFPYSLTVGGLYVRPDAGIGTLADLAGHKLGIAGGPVDKSWLLLQAYARSMGTDLGSVVEPAYAAPPLLNRLMLDGQLPAVLNFWHYGARLEAAGMRPLLDVETMLAGLGIDDPVPMLGWVFSDAWAQQHGDALRSFLQASYAAKRLLGRDDDLWQAIRALTKAEDDATLQLLRDGYRRGIPHRLVANGETVAAQVFDILEREGGARLVGDAQRLLPGTFWDGLNSADLAAGDAAGQ